MEGDGKFLEKIVEMMALETNVTTRTKRWFLAVMVFVSLLCWFSVPAHASWWINPKTFHASVHGQTPCQNCHEDIGKQGLHPNPEEIAKGSQDRFQLDHCLVCHEEVMSDLEKGKHGSQKVQDLEKHKVCLGCHDPHEQAPIKEKVKFDPGKPRHEQCGACQTPAQALTGEKISLVNPAEYVKTPHANVACVTCHPLATETGHGKNIHGDCRQCHLPYHDEKIAHDLHGLVACGSCHLQGTQPERDPWSKHVVWKRTFKPGQTSHVHQMVIRNDEASCRHCHSSGNQVGAASMVLPAKSIICMPCHAGTFSVGDTTTILTLIAFAAGLVMVFSYVLTGASSFSSLLGGMVGAVFSKRIGEILKVLVLDVLFQRRLYRQSPKRWLIHGLIFYAFAFRFLWGIIALIGSLWKPEWTWIWPMLDKNSPFTAFLFDLTGVMIIVGVLFAYVRGRKQRSDQVPDLPRQDVLALGLIAAIVVVGFILEGMRIAMTGFPEGSCYAFLGCAIGRMFFSASSLVNVYGFIWYLHAILTGAFIAYLPFSKLLHIIISPFVLMGTATRRHEHGTK